MKTLESIPFAIVASVIMLLGNVDQTHAQFDFGQVIDQQAEQAFQRLGSEIRDGLRRELPQILPYDPNPAVPPPQTTLPYFPEYPDSQPNQTFPTHPQEYYLVPEMQQPFPYSGPQTLLHYDRPQTAYPNASTVTRKAVVKKKLPEVGSGGLVRFSQKQYGNKPGRIFLKAGTLNLEVEIVEWVQGQVRGRLPYLPLLRASDAVVQVVLPNNILADQAAITIKPTPRPPENNPSDTKPSPPPTVSPGQRLHVKGKLGAEQGQVKLQIGGMALSANIVEWTASKVNFDLPKIELTQSQTANVVVVTSDGKSVRTIEVVVAPAKK